MHRVVGRKQSLVGKAAFSSTGGKRVASNVSSNATDVLLGYPKREPRQN